MAGKEMIMMSQKELKRLHIIHKVLDKEMTQREAAPMIGLTDRQIRRIIKRIRKRGEDGICHGGRGRASNRRLPKKVKSKVIRLYREKYADFGPTLASEKLLERDRIQVSESTLRRWFKAADVSYPTRGRRPHRQWRERKLHFGEMVQMDGSHHDWFEGRGPRCVLMAYTDDATGEVYARFYEYEGTLPALDGLKRYIEEYGIPLSVYLDRHTTYKSTAKTTIEEELHDTKPMSQFERALAELGVEVIHAYSPQAKGRVERLFGTFQDRVVKEMRLAGINDIQTANAFLEGYLPIYNQRFTVAAVGLADLHRPVSCMNGLDGVLCIKVDRTVRNDFTISYEGKRYQIDSSIRARKVTVEERTDGYLHITYQGTPLKYREIPARGATHVQSLSTPILSRDGGKDGSCRQRNIRRKTKPALDHPWRRGLKWSPKENTLSVT